MAQASPWQHVASQVMVLNTIMAQSHSLLSLLTATQWGGQSESAVESANTMMKTSDSGAVAPAAQRNLGNNQKTHKLLEVQKRLPT